MWDAWDDQTNFQRNLNTGEVEVDGSTIFHVTEYRERRDHFAWFACSEEVTGFDTSRDAFLGPYRGWDRPVVVETGRATGSVAHGWAPMGSHHVALTLAPGETREVRFALGYFENPRDAKFDEGGRLNQRLVRPVIDRYLDGDVVEAAFGALRSRWTEVLDQLQVSTPNEHVDRMVNTWNAYQCMVTFNLSRSASYFESGIGRGMGFRDCCQDLLGFVQMAPDAGARAHPRRRGDPARVGRRVSPVRAAHEAGQRRDRLGLQRRPAVARARGCRVPEGDGRPVDPRRARALRLAAGE